MKRGILLLLSLFLPLLADGKVPEDSLRVLFWNAENLFDPRDGGAGKADTEFSARGERHWTRKRFQAKCNTIAKTILWAADEERCPPGDEKKADVPRRTSVPLLPDVIGLAEVENAFVLRQLIQTTALRKLDYQVVHFESPDPRGIDVALLYRSSRLRLINAKPCHLYNADSSVMATRDILLAQFIGPGGDLAVLVNHHPSKYGGTAVSEPRRKIAVLRLKQLADSLTAAGVSSVIAMGDFNDTPANPVYKLLEPTLQNYAEPLFRQGEGTIRYEGVWELIDMFFSLPGLQARMTILHPPFLETPDNTHGGTKPFRTYAGPRYLGGVSDHCPILLDYITPTDPSSPSAPQDDRKEKMTIFVN